MIPEKIKITIRNYNQKNLFKKIGYEAEIGEEIEVKTSDLPKGSHIKLPCTCDYCGNIKEKPYKDYIESISSQGLYSCKDCKTIKTRITNLERYGAVSPSCNEEIKEKTKQNNILCYGVSSPMKTEEGKQAVRNSLMNKYGVDHYSKTEEYKIKYKSTSQSRYGVSHPMQCEEIKEKVKATTYLHYGYEYATQSPEVKKKTIETNREKYGCDYPFFTEEVKEKISASFYKHSTQKVSKQQNYINNIYNGILNYPCGIYNLDIVVDNFDIEFDGKGHFLSIIFHDLTEKEFKRREIIRSNYVKKRDYKIIRIISLTDKLPSDTILLQMLSYARNYFQTNPQRSWITFDIDNSCIYNAYHKETTKGIPYDYGTLRRIK